MFKRKNRKIRSFILEDLYFVTTIVEIDNGKSYKQGFICFKDEEKFKHFSDDKVIEKGTEFKYYTINNIISEKPLYENLEDGDLCKDDNIKRYEIIELENYCNLTINL